MKTRVYQIVPELDVHRVKFWELDTMRKHYGDTVPAEIYRCVYDGDLNTANLERIYTILNTDHPIGYKGHSLSVSDVVELEDDTGTSSYYFCDTTSFQSVSFRKELIKSV